MRIASFFPSIVTLVVTFCPSVFDLASAPPAIAQAVTVPDAAARTTVPQSPTLQQQRWLNASPNERLRLAEALGEDGARTMAKSKGWKPLMDGTKSTLRQGFDQVYHSADGVVHVVEAKGGTSPLGHSYGHPQGSAEWAVKAAERTLKSAKASAPEKEAARAALRAAKNGKMQVHVVRTKHVLGEPTAAVMETTTRTGKQAARLANSVLDDAARAAGQSVADVARTVGQSADDIARTASGSVDDAARGASAASQATGTAAKVARGASKVAVPIAIAVDGGFRVHEGADIESRYAEGALTQQEREVAHAKNAAGMAGGWCGAAAGAKVGALGGGAAGSCVAPGPGTLVGGIAGTVAGGVAGYIGGEAAAESAAEWTVNNVHSTGTTISEGASDGWNWTKRKTSDTWYWATGR